MLSEDRYSRGCVRAERCTRRDVSEVPRALTIGMAEFQALRLWPGYVTTPKKPAHVLHASMSNHKWLVSGVGGHHSAIDTLPDFKVTPSTAASDARVTAGSWVRHPSYKITLLGTQKMVDANNDGLIDRNEFTSLLRSSGYMGDNMNALWATLDKDNSGHITAGELKLLSQGKSQGLGNSR